jgi:hypothetical protein
MTTMRFYKQCATYHMWLNEMDILCCGLSEESRIPMPLDALGEARDHTSSSRFKLRESPQNEQNYVNSLGLDCPLISSLCALVYTFRVSR